MNDMLVKITYRDGREETDYVCEVKIIKGCLGLRKRFDCVRFIPLDTIKEWRVYD